MILEISVLTILVVVCGTFVVMTVREVDGLEEKLAKVNKDCDLLRSVMEDKFSDVEEDLGTVEREISLMKTSNANGFVGRDTRGRFTSSRVNPNPPVL